MYDVAIIGAGISGAAVAFELSRYKLSVALIERENDVAMGTTRANSAIIHAGYDPEPGTLMARYNAPGNRLTVEYCEEYGVSFKRTGSLVVAFNAADMAALRGLFARGLANGVPSLELISGEGARRLEPMLSPGVKGALLAPTAAVVSPWELCLSLAENAVLNGVDFLPGRDVESIKDDGGSYIISGKNLFDGGAFCVSARVVVNAAGVYADRVADMAGGAGFKIEPAKGEYYLLDKASGGAFSRVVFQCPTKAGKGVLIAPTVHGNLIAGPNSGPPEDREDVSATAAGLEYVAKTARRVFPGLNLRDSIRNFAGLRANADTGDFIIGFEKERFINVAGIKSPGLSCAMAFAADAAALVGEAGVRLEKKERFLKLKRPRSFKSLSAAEKNRAIAINPAFGHIICRCETITEGEALECFSRPIPPVSMDGIKRRVNAGMGRCQGGFCGPRVHELLSNALKISMADVIQDREGSYILTGPTKEGAYES